MPERTVFISYDHRDSDWVTATLVPSLRKAGLQEYHDSQVGPGVNVYDWIDRGRSQCNAFILVISRNYVENRSYARAEMMDFVAGNIRGQLHVVPVLKEWLPESELPFGLRCLRRIEPRSLDAELRRLADELNRSPKDGMGAPAPTSDRDPLILSERRIRIQASVECTQKCPWCHWDQFPSKLTPRFALVKRLMEQLKEARDSDRETYPRPNIYFALTGGEPLANKDGEVTWRDLASVDPPHTFLLTNGRLLNHDSIGFIRNHQLKHIRVDLPVVPGGHYRDIRPVSPHEPIKDYYDEVLKGVHALLEEADMEVRFNYVVEDTRDIQQIESYLNFVRAQFNAAISMHRISGVAFIEQFPRKPRVPTIVDMAGKWAERHHATIEGGLRTDPSVRRKIEATTQDGMRVEFVQLNCAAPGDVVMRCFTCVQEQDIAISADGRIRVCSGWDAERRDCHHVFAHFDSMQPLVGISGVIRRRYGIAGFYSHFRSLSRILSGATTSLDVDTFDAKAFGEFLGSCGLAVNDADMRDFEFVPAITSRVLGEEPVFRRLYEEGTYSGKHLENSTVLCCYLLRAAYKLASRLKQSASQGKSVGASSTLNAAVRPDSKSGNSSSTKTERLKASLNGILLLLEYLCVDEGLFSTTKALMVRSMSTDLLRALLAAPKTPPSGFLADSSYCLCAAAAENCDADVVLGFLNAQVSPPEQLCVPWVQYLVGCLHRQSRSNRCDDAAIAALECAYNLADEQIRRGPTSALAWLLYEIRAEAKRSLGAIRRGRPKKLAQAQRDFAQANFLSSVDRTRFRYAALFSDGYASMLRYFRGEFGRTNLPSEGYKAHRDFSESIALNPTFYASLIRMGLLELALRQPRSAVGRLRLAKQVFSKRGLLTDQEYLNSILCDLIHAAADGPAQHARLPQVHTLGIADCQNVGKADALCVKQDAEFLCKCLEEHRGRGVGVGARDNGAAVDALISEARAFVTECGKLASRP